MAEDVSCRPLRYVQDDFPKSDSHKRPDAGTLETSQEIKSFSSSGTVLI